MLRFERQPPGTAITRASLVVGGASAAVAGVLIVDREPELAAACAAGSAVVLLIGGHRANHGAGGPTDRMLDELMDRWWDATVLGTIAWVARTADARIAIAALVALCLSALSSYVRARGASLSYSVEESHVTRGIRYALGVGGSRVRVVALVAVGGGGGVAAGGHRSRVAGRPGRARLPRGAGRSHVSVPGETWQQTVAFHVYRLAAWFGRTLPEHLGHRVYRRVGLLAHDLMPGARRVVAANQAQVLGRPPSDPLVRASTKEAFATYARYWFDTFHVAVVSDEEMRERFHTVDVDNLWVSLEGGKGVICALPHMGNWDAAGRWLVATGQRLVSVAEQLEPPRVCSTCSSSTAVPWGWTSSARPMRGWASSSQHARREPRRRAGGRPRPQRARRRGHDVREGPQTAGGPRAAVDHDRGAA